MMNTAFTVAYPPDRSWLARVLLPLVQPRAYLRAIHLLLMFPLGIGYFVFFVTAFAFGGAMIWTFVGPPVLLLALFASLYIGDVEAWLVNLTTGEDIKRPPKVLEGVTSLRDKVWTRLIDPSTWTGVFYEVAQFPIGIASFVVVVVGFSIAGAFIVAPVLVALDPESIVLEDGPFAMTVDQWWEALPFVPLGILAWLITMHVIALLSSLHAAWARLMLGTRSRRGRETGAPASPSDPEPKPPVALLPPVESERSVPVPQPGGVLKEEVGPYGDRKAPDGLPDHASISELTSREREVLKLVARGYTNADICEELVVSEGTVKTHVRHILGKLGLTDRVQVIVFAYENGLVLPEGRSVPATMAARGG